MSLFQLLPGDIIVKILNLMFPYKKLGTYFTRGWSVCQWYYSIHFGLCKTSSQYIGYYNTRNFEYYYKPCECHDIRQIFKSKIKFMKIPHKDGVSSDTIIIAR